MKGYRGNAMDCFIMISGVWFSGTVIAESGDCATVQTAIGTRVCLTSELQTQNPLALGVWPV